MVFCVGRVECLSRGVRHELAKRTRFPISALISSETNIVYGAYTELGGAFGPIQAISDLISAVISSDFRANRTRFHPCRTPRPELWVSETIKVRHSGASVSECLCVAMGVLVKIASV